jgi:hypothetical protein
MLTPDQGLGPGWPDSEGIIEKSHSQLGLTGEVVMFPSPPLGILVVPSLGEGAKPGVPRQSWPSHPTFPVPDPAVLQAGDLGAIAGVRSR